jgi:hypothetical protein
MQQHISYLQASQIPPIQTWFKAFIMIYVTLIASGSLSSEWDRLQVLKHRQAKAESFTTDRPRGYQCTYNPVRRKILYFLT